MFNTVYYKLASKEKIGRIIILFFLFLLALYEFYSIGIIGYALVCIIPLLLLGLILVFRYQLTFFWIIFFINYTMMGISRYYDMPIPITMLTLMPQLLLVIVITLDVRKKHDIK